MRTGQHGTTKARQRRANWAWLLILALGLGWSAGCGDNPGDTVLLPPGGSGDIVGKVTFQDDSEPPFPVARVLAFQNNSPNCRSDFGAIALMGDYNEFAIGSASDYLMTQAVPCLWFFEYQIDAGPQEFKFTTGNDPGSIAWDTPGDYGNVGTNNFDDPLQGDLDNPANGPDGNISLTMPETGTWYFVLNEASDPATYRISQTPLFIETNVETGEFAVTDLPVGIYEVTIAAEGYLSRRIQDLEVAPNDVVDLGDVLLEVAQGSLSGVVEFADDPDVRPTATVKLSEAGSTVGLQTMDTDSSFAFVGLASGTYDITVTAPGYLSNSSVNIDYANGEDKDVGAITLQPGCQTTFDSIALVGAFNDWNPASPSMTQTEPGGCTWVDTLSLETGTYFMKFVTNGAFDNPLDYGGDQNTQLTMPGGPFALEPATGEGTALNIVATVTGEYIFTLDEAASEFVVELIGEAPEGGIQGTVAFTGFAQPPYPRATIGMSAAGGGTVLRTATSDPSTGVFSIESVPDGTYDLAVSSPCFTPSSRTNVTVAGTMINVGVVLLAEGVSTYTTIQAVGDFNGWSLETPSMHQQTACVWTDTVLVSSASYPDTLNMKFVTDGAFDDPSDYGGDQSEVFVLPGTFPVRVVSGPETAIRIGVSEETEFIFTLDERRQQFTVEPRNGSGRARSRSPR